MKKICRKLITLLMCIITICVASEWNKIYVYAIAVNEVVASVDIKHQHSGDAVHGGGCYTSETWHTCNGSLSSGSSHMSDTSTWFYFTCDSCGAWPGYSDPHANNYNRCNAHIHDGWTIGCGLSAGQKIGSVELVKDKSGALYTLSVSSTIISKLVIDNYTWNTGETTSTINVTDNKEYSCTINYRDNGVSRSTVLNYNVMDYDNIPPVINSISLNITDRTNNNVMLTPDIFDNYSGVAGFSVNGGSYITGSYEVTSNGLYSIKAKDVCDNETTSTYDITISNIDKEAPVVDNVTFN